MRKNFTPPGIRLRGVRQNNLKGFDLDIPLNRLIVVTGLSGSGKSSLAFETLFAEGQRRYIETFSPYARQFLDRMDKPRVDSIEGIPPAIAIEQRNSVKSTRSTVGTMTEICDFAKVFWPHLTSLFCRQCGQAVRQESPAHIWDVLSTTHPGADGLITFQLPLSRKFSAKESIDLIAKQGYQRLLFGSDIVRLEESVDRLEKSTDSTVTVVQDRLTVNEANRARLVEACEQAFHFGHGKLTFHILERAASGPASIRQSRPFSNRLHCAPCDIEYREATPALFSFNHPIGACPACKGFGRIIAINYDLAIPDRSKTLAGGAVKPWQTGVSAECQQDMAKFARIRNAPMDVPFEKLSKKWQAWVVEGDPGYGSDADHQWPKAWYGVKGYFKWLESKSYKMHVRVLLSRYRIYQTCPACHGDRFQPESLLYRIGRSDAEAGLTLADFYRLPIHRALDFVKGLLAHRPGKNASDPVTLALREVHSRLGYLKDSGLGYLSLDRATRSLSGGETERVSLTSCLGSRLVNTLFVLDEPSVGLHPRDTARLIRILEELRDAGNTVVVVEHEASVMRAADQIIDLGPGHGETGGSVVFQGSYPEILKSQSLTGQYLSGARRIEVPKRRPVKTSTPSLTLHHANLHNLSDLTVRIPLGRFICVTGVSGSGKTTLIREVLLPALDEKLRQTPQSQESRDADEDGEKEDSIAERLAGPTELHGWESLSQAVLVDQSALGKTPRSNPAVYIGAFDDIRDLFAHTEVARQRGLASSAFSFNSAQGQCERCRGAGFEKIEMQFLSDVFIKCPDCQGRRYRPHILEVRVADPKQPNREWSIADLLEATVDEVIDFLGGFTESRPAKKALSSLALLQEVGLGYLRLGQPINTLSGGESQRLKLVSHLASVSNTTNAAPKPILFLFDEPTTGLHFDDTRVLLKVFQRLVNAGHSVLVIEHNIDVVRAADWIIDLGPDGGEGGGKIVITGTPEQVTACRESHTGQALAAIPLVS